MNDSEGQSPANPSESQAENGAAVAFDSWNDDSLRAFIVGGRTLGELQGITKYDQMELAKIGHSLFEQGDLETAEKVFRGLLVLDPFDAYFLTALGALALRRSEFEDADQLLSRALEINPFSAVARTHRGEARLERGQLVEAVDDLVEALRLDPDFEQPSTHRAQALALAVKAKLEETAV